MEEFKSDLTKLINRHSLENDSDTPDFIIAAYLVDCLESYNKVAKTRDKWFGYDPWKKLER